MRLKILTVLGESKGSDFGYNAQKYPTDDTRKIRPIAINAVNEMVDIVAHIDILYKALLPRASSTPKGCWQVFFLDKLEKLEKRCKSNEISMQG